MGTPFLRTVLLLNLADEYTSPEGTRLRIADAKGAVLLPLAQVDQVGVVVPAQAQVDLPREGVPTTRVVI